MKTNVLMALVLAGVTVGGTAIASIGGGPAKIHLTKEQRDTAKMERKLANADRKERRDIVKSERHLATADQQAVAVPEPSGLLLAFIGMSSVLAGAWYVRRRDQKASDRS